MLCTGSSARSFHLIVIWQHGVHPALWLPLGNPRPCYTRYLLNLVPARRCEGCRPLWCCGCLAFAAALACEMHWTQGALLCTEFRHAEYLEDRNMVNSIQLYYYYYICLFFHGRLWYKLTSRIHLLCLFKISANTTKIRKFSILNTRVSWLIIKSLD